jgi:proline dehydrogenase
MKLEPGTIYTLKLISGEEITAKIVNWFVDSVEVTQPISMVLGQQGLQMMPSLFSANQEKNVHINTATIVMQAETREDVKAKYIEATTGIATPPAKQIITG